ncbi:FAD-binding oxidoreductase [Hellea balneolensis]|uniref:FAD-binding oxidoreductase n=1 Tax=Hellea balneolensis TaxID=287478 RepID=UPI00040F7B17|nr:FAD-binding oxidoreductase [Hellea balneolensis]
MLDGLKALKSALPAAAWTQDADIIAPHLVEWRDKYFGKTPLMLTPRSTAEVSEAVKVCAAHGLKIVPQGGNTGLVGGQTPQGEVLFSLKKMTTIRAVDAVNNAMTAEAGATLQSVHDAADKANRKFPLFLASQGSCTIGGNLSTNAGGNHVLKYGTTKDLVFGVEAVLASGEIYNGLTSLRKDNTGYDLSRLFLGAEGTLGIITAASLKLFPKASYTQRVITTVESPAKALDLLEHCRASGRLGMFEVMPQIGFNAVVSNIPDQRDPFETSYTWYVIIDWDFETEAEGSALAEKLLSSAFEKDLIRDAVIAQNETQAAQIMSLRENMSAGQKFLGGSIKFDITVPLNTIPAFFKKADAAMEAQIPGSRPVGFGHFGDGNIHYNIAQPVGMDKEEFLNQWQSVSEIVFDIVGEFGGSISAEHGIGIMKKTDLAKRADPVKMAMMRSIKQALDPDNIMNPRVMI